MRDLNCESDGEISKARSFCLTLFSGAQRQDKGQWAQIEAEEVPAEHEEELLPSEGDGALEQAAQGGWGSLLLWRYSRPAWTWYCAACSG